MKLLIALCIALPGLMAQDAPEAWRLHGQATTVTQQHGPFTSPYEGANSLQDVHQRESTFTTTLMTAFRPWQGGEVYLDGEGAAGEGCSGALGLAGSPNGEAYRVGNPAFHAAVVRLFLKQTWALGGQSLKVEDDAHQLAGSNPSRRIVLELGKFSVMDFFDNNTFSHDPRSQFLNWVLMGHGAWDYPADTRGYTEGVAAECFWDAWSARMGRFAEPTVANMMKMDTNFMRAHGDALELEHDHTLGAMPGAIRLLVYRNVADMGNYREALAEAPAAPDIVATRQQGTVKHGYGVNVEQALTPDLGAFTRWSWDDGRTESWAFTEVDRSLTGGIALRGTAWHRPQDTFGLAAIQNGLGADHRAYLAAGGMGFLIGDGRLNYQPERIYETYYACAMGHSFTASLDLQRCWNPAYNADRGPVSLVALRCHAQF